MSKQYVICVLCWLFGRGIGLHLVYLERPVQALLWYLVGDYSYCWIFDLFLIPHYMTQLAAASSETPQQDSERPKTVNVRSLMAFEVWHSTLLTDLAIVLLLTYQVEPEWMVLIPIVTVPLSVWWVAGTVHWQAVLVSGVLGYGLFYSLCYTIIRQGPMAAELLSKTDQKKFLTPLLTTTILNVWQHRTWLTAQCVRLVKLIVKLLLVLLVSAAIICVILRPYYLTYNTRDKPNKDNSRQHYTHRSTMTEDQKVLNACEVLSVHPGVSEEMLTVVYRHLVRQWHPDKHQGQESKDAATQRFIQIQEAYQYMSNKLTKSRGRRK